MNSDIRLSVGWNSNPKIVKLRRKLGADGVLSLINLWTFVGEHRPSGVMTGMDDDDIAISAAYPGSTESLVSTFAELRLIERHGNDWAIHDWKENNPWAFGFTARSKKAKKAIQARWDKRNNSDPDPENSGKNTTSIESHTTGIEKTHASNTPSPSPSPSPTPKDPPLPPGGGRERDRGATVHQLKPLTPEFEQAKALYPQRDGGHNWQQAQSVWTARIREGIAVETMLHGTKAYAQYIRKTGKEGTQYVKTAQVFYGTGRHFLTEWAADEAPQRANSLTGRSAI